MDPLISIIIPCFNSGLYLQEAIQSVKSSANGKIYEIIVVDDGSTDGATLDVLNEIRREHLTVARQENQGPAAARNAGVGLSKAPYLLFLDSDNRVRPNYIEQGIKVLNNDPEVAVVYGKPSFFGDVSGRQFSTRPFEICSLLRSNYIDMCAVVRKEAWRSVGGLDQDRRIIGHEDWEFWVRLAGNNWKFHFVDEELFDYRIQEGSLITKVDRDLTSEYIFKKNAATVVKCYGHLYNQFAMYKNDKDKPLRSFFKYVYHKLNLKTWLA